MAVLNETVKIIRNEMKDFIRKKSILQGPLSIESVSSFRWEDALQEFDSLPWLSNCVKAAMCTKNAQDVRIPEYVSYPFVSII